MNQEEANAKLQEIAATYARVFATHDGRIVLTDLLAKFKNRQITGQDQYATMARAAQHDVVLHILSLVELGNQPAKKE